MRPLRVLVCGTNYGSAYLAAIRGGSSTCELAGILARGSARSRRIAGQYSLPLYTSVAELPDDLDLACVAIGSAGHEIVLQLVERGMHILCEHPQTPTHLQTAFDAADRRDVCFHVNSHFGDLAAAEIFSGECARIRAAEAPRFLDFTASDRALWGALEILRRATASLEPFEFLSRQVVGPFHVIHGSLGQIPASLEVQRSVGSDGETLEDGSVDYLVDLRLAIGFPTGILSLLSIGGPVVWNPNLATAANSSPLWSVVSQPSAGQAADLAAQRAAANLKALDRLARHIRTGVWPSEVSPRHPLQVSRVWQELGRHLAGR